MPEFVPPLLLRNGHLMTIAGAFWPRRFPNLPPAVAREFQTEPGTRVLAHCHWQPQPERHPAVVLLHGLEGSSDSGYMLGTAEKAYQAGFSAIRLNQRNCGGTEKLTSTLYNSSLSCDLQAVISELIACDHIPQIFAAGFSMGGNLVLKMAGEMAAAAPPQLRAIAALCPSFVLDACADALSERQNFIYQKYFVRRLKRRMRTKIQLYPDKYSTEGLNKIRSVREFDDKVTAPHCGFRDAADYYHRASASRVISAIRVPTLIITAQDDPFVPFRTFADPALAANPHITLLSPTHGGHCSFISSSPGPARFWAESRLISFFQSL
jgi:uncharacterized protein